MNGSDLRKALSSLGISQVDFARLVGVTTRAVSLWLTEEREIPGPAEAYLGLLMSMPVELRSTELAKLREEKPPMFEGMYEFRFQAKQGTAIGTLVFNQGRIFGTDGDVRYDGTYERSSTNPEIANIRLDVVVPAGVPLITGKKAEQFEYRFDIQTSVALRKPNSVRVTTPFGQVVASVKFLRDIPGAAA